MKVNINYQYSIINIIKLNNLMIKVYSSSPSSGINSKILIQDPLTF